MYCDLIKSKYCFHNYSGMTAEWVSIGLTTRMANLLLSARGLILV